MSHRMTFALAAAALFAVISGSAAAQSFEGRKKCSSCHKSQAESWGDTAHAKAMESLKPGTKEEAKKKAKLDPKKDYTKDKDCVGCHVDGWGKEGGYTVDDPNKFLTGVGCESCHGPGSKYRGIHRKSGAAYEKSKKTTPRSTLAEAGQDFAFEESCNACHMNYEGSPWKGVKKPYTPYHPGVDKKYTFNFDKYVKDVKAMHEHYKLDGVFEGDPKFKYHDDFQSKAKVGKKTEVDD
jgi:hypothetical protein